MDLLIWSKEYLRTNHPLCKDIFNQYTEEEIAHNTKRQIHLEAKTNQAAKEQEENAKNIKYREDIWEMKQTFLNMDIVKKESNKDLRRKIRKSRTVIEAQAYGIACILREDEQSGTKGYLIAATLSRSFYDAAVECIISLKDEVPDAQVAFFTHDDWVQDEHRYLLIIYSRLAQSIIELNFGR